MSSVSDTKNLRALIQAARDANDLSYEDIATRGGLPKSTVHAIATREDRTDVLPVEILDGLALGIGVPASKVRQAALLDAGFMEIDDPVMPETVLLTEALKDMTEEQRKAYVAVMLDISKAYRSS